MLRPGPLTASPTWQVNDTPFQNLTREEAVQFLQGLPPGEEIELVTQRKQDSECVRIHGPVSLCVPTEHWPPDCVARC
jgi:hypothetical protein